ncbi:MAG: hypothetical protein ACPGTQ_11225 [Colwellia sp.]
MSSIAITYDSRQDRLLLKTGLSIEKPTWWITRRQTKKLISHIFAATKAQYETQKLLEQLSSSKETKPTTEEQGSAEFSDKGYEEFHQAHNGNSSPEVSQSKKVNEQPEQFPLVANITIDLNSQQGIKLVLLDGKNKGICIELTQEGLYRFSNMLTLVSQKAAWI